MTFASGLYSTGLRLLTTYGESVSVTRDVITSFNPTDGTVSDGSDTTYSGYGYPDAYNSFDLQNTVIKEQDIKLYFSSSTTPLVEDIFTVGGVAYTVQNVQKVTAQGNNIIYIVQLRQ